MKKLTILVLAVCMLCLLTACGVSREAKAVTALIEAIGDVTLDSEPAIIAAEEAYAALTDEQKAEVEIADYLPIYRNNFEILKQQAAYEELQAALVGDWYNLAPNDASALSGGVETAAFSLLADGSAYFGESAYTWTLNPNMQTVRLEGSNRIVFEVVHNDEVLALTNPSFMTCMKDEDYRAFRRDALQTVFLNGNSAETYFGDAVDVGAVRDAEGNETSSRLLAFHSTAYDNGYVYYYCSSDFALDYSAGRKFHGALYEPFGAVAYPKDVDPAKVEITDAKGSVTFIRAEYVEELRFDPETNQRIITLTNGLTLYSKSSVNPTVDGNRYNAFEYLASPDFVF